MDANKFATMLHRNTNKITLILVYAVLEWILIVLLLLNSLFSYLIIKFAEFFGLKPPCLWCTRLDHVFDPAKASKNMHKDLLCEVHAKEVSNLGYCSNHQKLVDSQDMCMDCSQGLFFPWMKEKVGENGEVSLNCSCCGVSLLDNHKNIFSSYVLLKTSSWDVLECAQKENLITETGDCYDSFINQEGSDSDKKVVDFGADLFKDDEKVVEDRNENQILSELDENIEIVQNESEENGSVSICVDEMKKELEGREYEEVDVVLEMDEKRESLEESSKLMMKDKSVQVCVEEDAPLEISPQHLEFFLDYSGHKLVPVELMDSIIEENESKDNVRIEDHENVKDRGCGTDDEARIEEKEDLVEVDGVLDLDINKEPKFSALESMEMEEDENSLVFHAKDYHFVTDFENFTNFHVSQFSSEHVNDVQEMAGAVQEKHSDLHTECEELGQMENIENEADVSIGTDIPDLDIIDEIQNQESDHDDPSTSPADLYDADDNGPVEAEEQTVELQCLVIQEREHTMNEIEEDKFPDTPTSMDSLNHLHKKFLRDYAGTEDSIESGSVTSELEGTDGIVTVERLKSALRSERKALQELYAELEEERSASAIAANQTMAMINRLQEEKAAMQMEAVQYQRMMDEQSEYDQEALQLLNELMVKREREKVELEKELEVYRKRIFDYETKEKIRALRKSGFSSGSCSYMEDSDGLSIDLNQDAKEVEGCYCNDDEYGEQNTPVDEVVNLEESLADFEVERMSILAQLKVLEEKLVTLDDENELHFEDVKEMEDGFLNGHATNGFSNGKSRIGGHKGKSLLPLFDAISDESGDLTLNGNGFESNGVHDSFEIENKKLAIEEEVDHLYERLQALEADREFLKHCVNSLKKGDKGTDLLQEILQHLRDLRNVEFHAKNLNGTK